MIVRRRAVALGVLSGERIEILDGLKSGDEVIVQGAAQLIDGDLVQRIESPES